ncbi:uncharacterized protein CDV56_104401 [Aspergillus thermomutatus]|uniref:Uncharacterized protein n=1 Tax=Aspergillus thermomutatus TaxID=41047 RepID=A0A397GSB6_ASPTH|nr:uncharacterized protein CDV56_104401 [Aspergillus thermomutatus]RHZ53912.1 hypothetical protein CDV56_104401 [Aspergillus thermomutatus]
MAGLSDARKAAQKAAREEKRREERRQLREQRGYDPNAYLEKDAQRSWSRASPETKEVYRKRVRMYEEFLVGQKGMPKGYKVGKEHPVPTLEELKQLFRWYIDSTKGRLDPQGRPTMKTTLIRAQEFVPGFALETGKPIAQQDASELYSWIEKDLVKDKFIKAIEKPKYNIKPGDFERGMRTHWADDDPLFMSGRFRVQFHFVTLLYFCTGARVAALCPKSKNKAEQGLRYKIGYRLNQHWVKNNIDPDNTALGAAIWDCDEPLYAGALFLLALAIADGALFGYSSAADFFEQVIPPGLNQLPLRWNEEALDWCIIRHTTAKGVSEDPLSKERYQDAFRQILRKIYLNTPTIHDYRRHLAESVKGLRRKLTIQKVLELESDALLVKMRAEIDNAGTAGDRERLNAEYRAQKKRIYARKFERFRKDYISTDQQDYRRHLHDVHHYNKAICVPSEKARKKRSSSEIDEESIRDGNPPKRERRPRKQQKKSSAPPHASPKDLKIILWEPPTTQPQVMFPLPAEAVHENEECLTDLAYQAANHCEHFNEMLCTSPDDDNIRSALSDIMNVTDSPRPSAIGSVPSATVINPRILDISTTILSWSEGKHQQLDECDLREQLASSSLAERPGIDFPPQTLCAGPALDSTESQGDTVPETGNSLIFSALSPQSPLSKESVR